MYSQNNEDEIIKDYFGDKKLMLLDIGANDGVTFSNSKLLIENGWSGVLLEPSSVCIELEQLHKDNQNVTVINLAIASKDGMIDFYESGSIIDEKDSNLVSSSIPDERWQRATSFTKTKVYASTFKSFIESYKLTHFDFVSIDAEGMDWDILNQMDLTALGVSCVCIEWNSKPELDSCFTNYCNNHGLFEIHRNGENIIFVKDNK